ncbi:MAG: hypothetical protein AB1422_03155 [bacterium]
MKIKGFGNKRIPEPLFSGKRKFHAKHAKNPKGNKGKNYLCVLCVKKLFSGE